MTENVTDTLAALTQLAADAQQRADAATPGPWVHLYPGQCCQEACIESGARHEGVIHNVADLEHQDAKFMAWSRAGVPALVSGLRQTTTALHAVLDLHREAPRDPAWDVTGCIADGDDWPCPTVAAVVSALDGGAAEGED